MNAHALRILEYPRVREILTAYAATGLGRAAIARLEPLDDAAEVRARLAEVEELRRFLRARRVPLAGICEVSARVRALAEGGRPAEPDLLFAALGLLRGAEAVRNAFAASPAEFPRLAAIGAGIDYLPMLRLAIEGDIDARGEVRDSASDKLKALRAEIQFRRESLRSRAAARLTEPRLRPALQSEGV
ncbi:MAG: hypothetical protein ACRD2T_02150, partial [Thermoanaerobaculia bacterium]